MLSCFFFWRLYLRGFSQHTEPVWTSFVVHFFNFSPLPSASRALNSHYQAAVAKYLLPQSQAAKKSCRLLFQMVSPRFDMHVLDSTYLIYTFWVLVSEISSWLLLILSDIIYYYGFDNISQKRNIQVTIIQNLAPKHCSTEILLIIFFKPKKWTKKKTSGTLITSSGVLQLCTRTFDVIQSSSRSTALCWIAWIFFFEKNLHNFR